MKSKATWATPLTVVFFRSVIDEAMLWMASTKLEACSKTTLLVVVISGSLATEVQALERLANWLITPLSEGSFKMSCRLPKVVDRWVAEACLDVATRICWRM